VPGHARLELAHPRECRSPRRHERQWTRTNDDAAAGPHLQAVSESVIGERSFGVQVVFHDLPHRVHRDTVDALECGHDGLLGRRERRRHRHQARVAASLGGCVVGGLAERSQATLASGRDRRVGRARRLNPASLVAPARFAAPSGRLEFEQSRDLEAGLAASFCELPAGRDAHLDKIGSLGDDGPSFGNCRPNLGGLEGDAQPRFLGQTQDVAHLARRGAVGVEACQCHCEQLGGPLLGRSQSIGALQQFGLETQVDRAGRPVQGKLARRHVVFEHGHDERQDDATSQPTGVGAAVALSQRRGQRTSGSIQPVDAEHAQDGPFLGNGRGAPGNLRQTAGQVGGALSKSLACVCCRRLAQLAPRRSSAPCGLAGRAPRVGTLALYNGYRTRTNAA